MDSGKQNTFLTQLTSSKDSYSEIQGNIYNFESFANYSFVHNTKPVHHTFSKKIKLTIITLTVLTIVSLLISLVAIFIDFIAFNLIKYKKELALSIDNIYLSATFWICISLFFITIATSFGYFFAPECDGSGLPEVKAILSGVDMPNYLTLKTFTCKVFGLICCSGALSIGKEGPHGHLALIIASQILNLKIFKIFKKHPGVQTLIKEASVAAGVSAVMAAPIGSVLFSMEMTATYYMIQNVIYALYCGLVSTLVLVLFKLLSLTEKINETHIPPGYNNIDLLVFALIGILSGIIGVYFTILTKNLVRLRSQKKLPWLHKRFRYAWFVTSIYSFSSFMLPFMMLNAKQVFNQLLVEGDLAEKWHYCGSVGSLVLFMVLKMGFTSLSTSVQIPGGVFLPVLISGAAFGRLFYELSLYLGGVANVGMYAAVGGGAFIASTCHSLSVSIIVFEMTGQIHYVCPMLLAVIISYSIGSSIGLNVFDAFIVLKKIHYLPAIRKEKMYSTQAKEIAENANAVSVYANLKDLRDAVFNKQALKIVFIDENKYILGDFYCEKGKKYLRKRLEGVRENISKETYERLKRNINGGDVDEVSGGFWEGTVDFSDKVLKINRNPLAVQETMLLSKIQYLFLMLGLTQVYVTKNFRLCGVIYRHHFTNPKK